ncbi:MAG: hypothetical protein LBC96_01820 [Lachnospiraceae bacterium]|jgi:hypothetical protein|nr:hypothetical protein [Lachnospiraceae bacterium]
MNNNTVIEKHNCIEHLDKYCKCQICGQYDHDVESDDDIGKAMSGDIVSSRCRRCRASMRWNSATGHIYSNSFPEYMTESEIKAKQEKEEWLQNNQPSRPLADCEFQSFRIIVEKYSLEDANEFIGLARYLTDSRRLMEIATSLGEDDGDSTRLWTFTEQKIAQELTQGTDNIREIALKAEDIFIRLLAAKRLYSDKKKQFETEYEFQLHKTLLHDVSVVFINDSYFPREYRYPEEEYNDMYFDAIHNLNENDYDLLVKIITKKACHTWLGIEEVPNAAIVAITKLVSIAHKLPRDTVEKLLLEVALNGEIHYKTRINAIKRMSKSKTVNSFIGDDKVIEHDGKVIDLIEIARNHRKDLNDDAIMRYVEAEHNATFHEDGGFKD